MKHTEIKFYCDVCTEQIQCDQNFELPKKSLWAYIKQTILQDGSELPSRFEEVTIHICDDCYTKYINLFPLVGYKNGDSVVDFGIRSK
jgi:hypothetical protein